MFKQLKEIKERLGENPELKPIYIGMLNFWTGDKKAEATAKNRLKNCLSCEFFIDEKNNLLKVNDTKIPILTNKQCGECGCVLSFKLRQSENLCNKWQK
jgi:hypothetical protein